MYASEKVYHSENMKTTVRTQKNHKISPTNYNPSWGLKTKTLGRRCMNVIHMFVFTGDMSL